MDLGVRELRPGDDGYPVRLSDTLADPPGSLWMSGCYRAAERTVAIVGARAASVRGEKMAREIGEAVATAGIDVISGGALGIDSAAHRGALDGHGVTVAVLGTGIDIIYPQRHADLFQEIVREGGALLTQFPPGLGPRRFSFPTRNKIVAALGDALVVVEASGESGSLHTARAARAFHRRVLAVPGSAGTDALLLEGALPVACAADVVAVLQGGEAAPPILPEDPDALRLYAALDRVPRDVSDLAFRAGLAVGTCAAAVIDLELGGLVARAAGGRYLRLW